MLRNRVLLTLLGGFFAGTVALANDVGYVDCTGHPEDTPVAAKAAKTDEVVATLACGERFLILQSGFFYTRIQTKDGKVGYVYSNQVSRDTAADAAVTAQPLAPAKTAARSSNPFATIAAALKPKPAPAQTMRLPGPPSATPTATAPKSANATAASAQPVATTAATQSPSGNAVATNQPSAAAVTPPPGIHGAVISAPATSANAAAPATSASFPAKSSVIVQSEVTATATVQPKGAELAATSTPAPAPTPSFPEKTAVVVQPEPSGAAQPDVTPEAAAQPAPEPPPAPFRGRERRMSSPRAVSLVELFGGYSFARMDNGGGSFNNLNGGLGSVAWNATSWLQLVADTSYNLVTISGTKNVLYGNHYGPRLFKRGRNRWGLTPFVEGLVGGSRADATVSGAAGYTTSVNCISYKAGGGLDMRTSRHLEVRLFEVDYYRTAFGTNLHQNNYWASAGIVLRLFGGGAE